MNQPVTLGLAYLIAPCTQIHYVTSYVIVHLLRRLFLVPNCFNLLNYAYV